MSKPSRGHRLHRPTGDHSSAVVFDSPHSGEYLPRHFRYACTRHDLMFLHDPYVNRLLSGVPGTGSPVLEALVHRSYIDLNRHEYEVDPSCLDGIWTLPFKNTFYTSRNSGVFPLYTGPRTNRLTPIYNEAARLTAADGEQRIRHYHRPYYDALGGLLAGARAFHGHCLHLNFHSYPRRPDQPHDDIILGDLNGKACAPDIRDFIGEHFKKGGYSVDLKGAIFSGGAIIQKLHNVPGGIHCLQIEIARDLYMDQESLAYLPGKATRIRKTMTALGHAVRDYMAGRKASPAALSPKT